MDLVLETRAWQPKREVDRERGGGQRERDGREGRREGGDGRKGTGRKGGREGGGREKDNEGWGGRSLQILDQNSQVSSSFLSVVTQGSL